MKAMDAYHKLRHFGEPVLHTRDVVMILKISTPHASKLLARLAKAKAIIPLKRGLWLIEKTLDPYQLAPFLTSPFPCYFSLQTALYFHGMISQIPPTHYLMTIARTHQLSTPVGDYSFHHVAPPFFFGFEVSNKEKIPMATPEKALIDYFYLTPARSKRFHRLPELTLAKNFSIEIAEEIIEGIPSKRTTALVKNKLLEIQ